MSKTINALVDALNKTVNGRFTAVPLQESGTQLVDSGSKAFIVADEAMGATRIRVGVDGKFKRGKPYMATLETAESVAIKLGARLFRELGDKAFQPFVVELARRLEVVVQATAAARKAAVTAIESSPAPVVETTNDQIDLDVAV